jgi:hypothetical protein
MPRNAPLIAAVLTWEGEGLVWLKLRAPAHADVHRLACQEWGAERKIVDSP